jgi:alginate O-acetyltransferase complex protein AlgI
VRYSEIADELKVRHHSLRQFGIGSRIFMIGFVMKTALADSLSPLVDAVFGLAQPTLVDAWTGAFSYTLQLYFDFGGYSLMAIGLARMMGFHFPQNFNNPYLSTSIQDFWQRWHMTLSRFLRDYLYIPFGGNRRGAVRTYVNLLMVMAIGGLWHGSSWNFIFWGIWHGVLLGGHRWFSRLPSVKQKAAVTSPMDRAIAFAWRNALTMLVVMLGWVIFRAHDLANAGAMYAGMLGLHGVALSDALAWQATPDRVWLIPLAIVVVYLPLLRGLRRPAPSPSAALVSRWAGLRLAWSTVAPVVGFMLAIVLLYSRAAVPFLYFQF